MKNYIFKNIYIKSKNIMLTAVVLAAVCVMCITAVMAVRAAGRIRMQEHIAGVMRSLTILHRCLPALNPLSSRSG